MLTRDQLEALSEQQLRAMVLVPLFQAMGYRDVVEYHGGSLEQGKDIVMWKPEDHRDRVNYGVVVKRRVNGKTTGSGSAGETVTQIQQCFAKPFQDQVTGEDRTVDRCLVVVAQEIPKEFFNAATPTLQAGGFDRDTNFIGLERLWKLVQKHLPEKTPMTFLQQFQTLLSENFPGLGADVHIAGDHMTVHVTPNENNPIPPQSITFRFSLKDDSGKAAREAYERFLKTGAEFTFEKGETDAIEISDFLKAFYGISEEKLVSFKFTPTPSPPVSWNFKRVCEDGSVAVLPRVELSRIKGGTEEATFSNQSQGVPWIFTLVVKKEAEGFRLQLSYRAPLKGASCGQVLQWLQFQEALARPGKITIEQPDTDGEIPISEDQGSCQPPDAGFVNLIEKLAYVEQRTGVSISWPGELCGADVSDIEKFYNIVKTGRVSLNSFTGQVEKERVLARGNALLHGGALNIEFRDDTQEQCLGVALALGPSRLVGENVRLDDQSAANLRAEMQHSTADELHLTFEPAEGGSLEWVFPKWLTSSDSTVQ